MEENIFSLATRSVNVNVHGDESLCGIENHFEMRTQKPFGEAAFQYRRKGARISNNCCPKMISTRNDAKFTWTWLFGRQM
mmetsp:Transcript_3677/g.5419  ORF Transcript_3677/g.5419 Transcript_3677/m.5419 type:complete len:80 (+) Transcript_3677:2137-2376(+)|eukprot:6649609-Ditylum_brightwellii.AAC.1